MFPKNIGEMFQRRVAQFAGTQKQELKQRIWRNTPYSVAFLSNPGPSAQDVIAYNRLNYSISVIYHVNTLHRVA